MQAKFTPPPWKKRHIAGAWLIHHAKRAIAQVVGHDAEDDANAALIAASPTMYQYIEGRAAAGDKEAQTILRGLK